MTSSTPLALCAPLAGCADSSQFGGKAANLGRLIAQGAEVPRGFALSHTSFLAFLSHNALQPRIDSVLAQTDFSDPQSVLTASQAIAALLAEATLPAEIRGELEKNWKALSAPNIIVRSSAIGEDAASASFAGQLDSFPVENHWDGLERCLKAVWASFWSSRALAYQHARGARLGGMGVVVQELVEAEFSGVLFTAAPEMQGLDQESASGAMLLEYVRGAGELLVSGHVNPGRLVVSKQREGFDVLSLPQQEAPAEKLVFPAAHVNKLRAVALRIEQAMGRPQDIEWCFDEKGELRIVQARPITVPLMGESRGKILWSNVNVNENYPDPISPLLYSIALTSFYHYFRNLGIALGVAPHRLARVEPALLQIVGAHGGRIYYNLTNIYKVICSLPFGGKVASYFDAFVGVEVGAKTQTQHRSGFGGFSLLREAVDALRIAGTSVRTMLAVPAGVTGFENDVIAHILTCKRNRAEGRQPRWEELQEEFARFLEIRFKKWLRASLADASAMFSYGLLGSFLKWTLPDLGYASNSLLKGIQGVISAEPPQKLWDLGDLARRECCDLVMNLSAEELDARLDKDPALAKLSAAVARFQEDWGFRCSGELMLSHPNFTEDRVALLEIIKGFTGNESQSPHLIIEKQREERLLLEESITKRLAGFLPRALSPRVHLFRALLRWTHASITFRERARIKQAQLYGQLRRTCLDLGARFVERGLLAEPMDILFLKHTETTHFLEGAEMLPGCLKGLVAARKAEYEKVTRTIPPDSFKLEFGSYFDPRKFAGAAAAQEDGDGKRLSGAGACGGIVRAKARVLTSVLQAKLLEKGDVLVTRQTDPGWAPVFPLIKGLVMERGGMLSHGAIVAREFGIPAVVGVLGATEKIAQGQEIEVDGDAGTVEIVG